MDLIGLIILVVLLGLVWWVLTAYVPMPPAGKTVLAIAFCVILIVALLSFLGVGASMLHYKPRL